MSNSIYRKLHRYYTAIIIVVVVACNTDDVYNNIPSKINSFITQYWPNNAVSSCVIGSSDYVLTIKNSITLTFDTDYNWISINGNGSVIPQVFLFDQLPPLLFEYLEATDSLDAVYSIERNSEYYHLLMFDTNLYYYIANGLITARAPS